MVENIRRQAKGFTIVELLIVIAVVGIIATLITTSISNDSERTAFSKAQADLNNIGSAVLLYANKYNSYPTPVAKGIPASLVEFIDAPQNVNLVNGPWPNSNYDYKYWDVNGDGVNDTITINVRFCPPNGDSTPIGNCTFPDETWAASFNTYSSVYYCVKGYCRSHPAAAYTNPGYCINCPGNTGIKYP